MKKFLLKMVYTINIIFYLLIVALWIAIPEEFTLNISVTIFNLTLSSLLICFDHKRFKKYYGSSKFKKLSSTLVSAFLIFCILGLINYLSYKHPQQIDLSKLKHNSLTSQTQNLLKKIKGPLIFKVFSRKKDFQAINALLELYRLEQDKISIEFIDIDLRPDLVSEYQIKYPNTIVALYGKKRAQVTTLNELNISNAVIKVLRKKETIIYYIYGHEEQDFKNSKADGLSELKKLLVSSHYILRPLNLAKSSQIPKNATGLILWGPKTGLLSHEVDQIEQYLKAGGKLLISLNPDLNQDKFKNLRKVLLKRGIDISNNLVIDQLKHISGSNGTVPFINKFNQNHPITSKLSGTIFFPLASSIQKSKNIIITGELDLLMNTSIFPASWAENSSDEVIEGKITYHAHNDFQGPISLMAAWKGALKKDDNKQSRMIVFGNSSFVSNAYAKYGRNFELFINSLAWLVDEDLISSFNIDAVKNEPILIGKAQAGVIFYFSVLFAPLLLFGLALYFYKRR